MSRSLTIELNMTAFFNTGLTQQQFLEQYWQKRPLLIKGAFTDAEAMLSPNDLAGLACESDIESRLIMEQADQWSVRHGPFTDDDFADLPQSHWTLLVQDVDKHLPDIQSVFMPFTFIPNWRRDDVMISYATDGGSVGPHTDSYDVFLMQAQGTRRWQITDDALHAPKLMPNEDLQILADFSSQQEWVLGPGDILYLPPHFGHHGVAVGECMTFSIGFRAPKQHDMLDAIMASMSEKSLGQQHYHDAELSINDNEYEIDSQAINRFKQQLHEAIESADPIIIEAMGKLVTDTKPTLEQNAFDFIDAPVTIDDINTRFEQNQCLHRNPYYRLAWAVDEQEICFFMAGECYRFHANDRDVLMLLVDKSVIQHQDWLQLNAVKDIADIVCELLNEGAWYWQ